MLWLIFLIHFLLFASLSSAHGLFNHDDALVHRFFVSQYSSRMMEALYANTTEEKIVDCYTYGEKSVIEYILKDVPRHHVVIEEEDALNELIDNCTYAKWIGHLPFDNKTVTPNEKFGIFSGLFMYPGTKWCGAGNVSSSYDDLGPEETTDRCCRKHDNCTNFFPERFSKRNLPTNEWSHCDCDAALLECLQQKTSTEISRRIQLSISKYQCRKCTRRRFPIIRCLPYEGIRELEVFHMYMPMRTMYKPMRTKYKLRGTIYTPRGTIAR